MIHSIVRVIEIVALLGCLSSCLYYLLCLWSAVWFLRSSSRGESTRARQFLPPVSILKPLKGTDPDIYESFRTHCLQDYPEYEIVFGVSDVDDPALASVRQLQREFPCHAIQLVICPSRLGANRKVSNLEQMLPSARYGHLIVNDSDIRVEGDYLRRVMAPLADDRVGMVTCLYRGVPGSTLGSRLESLGIGTDFCPGVLAARQIEGGLGFGLGSTLAFRRADLERIGGFKPIVDYLADDYELGRRIAALGLQVQLSDVVVETYLPAYDLRGFWTHQLRWARGVRDARAGGYFGLAATFGILWALLALILTQAVPWAWTAFGSVLALRLAVAFAVGRSVLRDQNLIRNLGLLPLRDLVAVVVWIASFAGQTVTWRGEHFMLRKGRLTPEA
jgi:ceramide glucosyltransferase